MKIIIEKNKPVIECDAKEGMEIIEKLLLKKIIKEIGKKEIGSGNYAHESCVSAEQKEIIRKIFTTTPDRSVRTVARELGLTTDQVRYWKDKMMGNEV
jgi:hypothetical protein